MITLNDVKVSDFEIGLSKLTGKRIKEIKGYISNPYGDPIFKITDVVFDDDTYIRAGGEHDLPYVCANYSQPNMDIDTLERLYDEQYED